MSQGFVNPKPSPLPVNQGGTGVLTSTGTVAVVLSTSPTLVTPTIGAATATSIKISNTGIIDTNGKVALALAATTNAVNAFTITNSIATASPSFSATGTDTNITMTLNGKGTGGVTIQGTTAGGNAAAGYVGEYLTGTASGVSLTSGVAASVVTLALTAGDWDVYGNMFFVAGATTSMTLLATGLSTTTAVLQGNTSLISFQSVTNTAFATGNGQYFPTGYLRFNVSSTTNVYLVAQATFGVSTMTATGIIAARRVR